MLQIRTMSSEDLPFAIQITSQMQWNLVEDDFNFMMELEPEGCFVAIDSGEKVGLATTISYGNIGWFGNLIVDETRRNKGTGSQLVKHSIEYLLRRRVKTIGLYAYEDRVHFYGRLDFNFDSDFMVMKGKGFRSPSSSNVKKAQRGDIAKVIEYDEPCFGGSRRKLLESIISDKSNLCCMITEDGSLLAYVVAKVYRGMAELGPLVCPAGRNDLALDLLRTVLDMLNGVEVHLFLPTKETIIINMLEGRGFIEEFHVARMFYGPRVVWNCIQAAESLERG